MADYHATNAHSLGRPMFERIVIQPQEPPKPGVVYGGALAETMLYYDEVVVYASVDLLVRLVRQISPEILLDLLKSRRLRIRVFDSFLGIHTATNDVHTPIVVRAVDRKNRQPTFDLAAYVEQAIHLAYGHSRKRVAQSLTEAVSSTSIPPSLCDATISDFRDDDYVRTAVPLIVGALAPAYQLPIPTRFEPKWVDSSKFTVETNLNYDAISAASISAGAPLGTRITTAQLLGAMANFRHALESARLSDGELCTDVLGAELLDLKFRRLHQLNGGQRQVEHFQNHVLDGARAVREALNSGRRSFGEFAKLLEGAERFRSAMRGATHGRDLLATYLKELQAMEFMKSIPASRLRFMEYIQTLTARGYVVSPSSLSELDKAAVESISNGWRPSSFVGDLRAFVGQM